MSSIKTFQPKHYFVSGTDTDSGKTFVSSALLAAVAEHYQAIGEAKTVIGFKPIASGCVQTEQGLRNSDALSLMAHSTKELPYSVVNPISFLPAIAPHIAAKQVGFELSKNVVKQYINQDMLKYADFTLVEGAGGWRLPLNDTEFLSDVISELEWPVILVVGMKLGCLNHAMLTQEAIINDGLKIAGWVANGVDENMDVQSENLESLKLMMKSPFLGFVPHLKSSAAKTAADYLDIKVLLQQM
ncbi:dethiobiotin synthase [Shewanella sp. 202IG2-18]|nr:dethiobiotin synthase [Parashewanella hymeniacidonis]